MHNEKIEQVNKIKYFGVWLDPLLNFSDQVDYIYVICKAKRSAAKVCTLFDGRGGISVPLARSTALQVIGSPSFRECRGGVG